MRRHAVSSRLMEVRSQIAVAVQAITVSAIVSPLLGQAPADLVVLANGTSVSFQTGPFVHCASGYEFYLALDSAGTLYNWGRSPIAVPSGPFVAVSASWAPGGWALALGEDGSIGYWGIVDSGAVSQHIPSGPFTAVAAGGLANAIALRPDGMIVQWGAIDAGTPPTGSYAAIAAGDHYGVALRQDRTVAVWGDPGWGTAILSPPAGQFTMVSAGPSFAVGIRDDGTLAAWCASGGGVLNVPSGTFVEVSAGDEYGMARRPDGTVATWSGGTTLPRAYSTIASGVQYQVGIATCYPNCDGSAASPTLNVADFTCFLQKFSAGEPYANCDASTRAPVLNVSDFTCFLQKFALGCGGR